VNASAEATIWNAILPAPDLDGAPADLSVALVLGGGNALGAYHAGLYEALHEAGVEPDWIVGTSIGAVTGAIIAGNPRELRLERLRQLWRPADARGGWPMPWDMLPDAWRRTGAVVETLVTGRAGMFDALGSSGGRWARDPVAGSPAVYDTRPLSTTLRELVDFDLLNRGAMRFTAIAVDVETGGEVCMDTSRQEISAEHVRASASLLTTFPAMEVDGRLMADGGLSMNLPLDPVMANGGDAPTLCIASDLLPLSSGRPKTLGEVAARMQDLTFAAQTRRSLEHWRRFFDAGYPGRTVPPSITLVTTAYTDQQREVAGKAMDFSPETILQRWTSGRSDGEALVQRLKGGEIPVGGAGLSIHRATGDRDPRPQASAA
jgi:NTE family protein